MIVLGLNHISDPGAALVVDGDLIAFAEEERFTRLKNSHNMFPGLSTKFCLQKAGITIDDVDYIVIPYNAKYYPFGFLRKLGREYLSLKTRKISSSNLNESGSLSTVLPIAFANTPSAIRAKIKKGILANKMGKSVPKIEFVDHHLCHAITASYFSGFDEALVCIVDGSGEANCTTVYDYRNGTLKLKDTYEVPNSLGWFYAAVTEYLGFQPYRSEGKTMGLAPYGERSNEIFEKMNLIVSRRGGRYRISPEYLLAGSHNHGLHFSDQLVNLFGLPRASTDPLLTYHKNIAFAAQSIIEECVKEIVNEAIEKYQQNKVCLAGGVAMNCKMNGSILYDTKAEDVFVFPAAGDAGSSVGGALYISGAPSNKANNRLIHTYLGPSFATDEIEDFLKTSKITYSIPTSIAQKSAQLLEKGKLVGWFQGAMEFGARALGNRSILANPLLEGIKEKVNKEVKFRENWRPFCPSLIDEDRSEYLQKNKEAPFMIVAHKLQERHRKSLSSISHIDGSIRPQTVTKLQNPLYHELISEFKSLTGHGILLNTSLNVRGEPIVCTPFEAARCFFASGLDAMAIGPFLLEK